MTSNKKPRLLLFRPGFDIVAPNNHHPQIIKMEKSFRHFFDVMVVDYNNYNYNQLLDKHEPDICLFYSIGPKVNLYDRSSIFSNTEVPKLGLSVMDAADASRYGYLKLMESIGVSNVFFVGAIMGEVFPEAQSQIFYYPHFIEPEINYDYGLGKSIPVLLTGNYQKEFYSWRYKIKKPVMDNFPALYFSHPGYKTTSEIPESLRIHGEKYFRQLSSSYVSLTCGSFKNALLMKHLEIPGARTCLVCDENNTVKEHGFRDMVNCVFASPENIVEKLKYIFEHPEKLEEITNNGYEFVQNHHTYKQRPQILQWYELNKQLKPGQKIIQPTLLGDLEIVDKSSDNRTIHLKGAMDVKWITEVDSLITKKKYVTAEQECKRVINIGEYIHDAKLRVYLIHMLNRRLNYGYKTIKALVGHQINLGLSPDPINLSLFILHLLAIKETKKAVYYSKIDITRRRKELDYTRLLAFRLAGEKDAFNSLREEIKHRPENRKMITFYYFYSKEFDLMQIMEKIVRKNVAWRKAGTYRYETLLKKPFHDAQPEEIIKFELKFDANQLKEDLKAFNSPVTTRHKLARKIQDTINKIIY